MIVFESVPIGSERRIADPTGVAAVQNNTAPTINSITLVAADPWKPITNLSSNLPGNGFNWQGPPANFPITVSAFDNFFNAIRKNEPVLSSFYQGYKDVEAIMAAVENKNDNPVKTFVVIRLEAQGLDA